ncbi:MAG: hypothetical protein ABEI96_09555 [Haloarculaceae archaeon]
MCPRKRSSTDHTRRTLLRLGAGAVATSLAAASGCVSSLPPVGLPQHFGRIDVPPADPPRYRRWLPAPSALDGLDGDHYRFLYRQPSRLDYPAPIRFVVPRKRLLSELDYFGVGYAAYDELLHTDAGTVVLAPFDRDTVARTLTESGYETAESYHDYDLFARQDVHRRAAVGDGVVVWTSERVHDAPDVEALVDARAGRVDRYHEENDGFARLSESIGESRMVELVPPKAGVRYWTSCEGFRFDDGTAYHVRSFRYPEGTEFPKRELKRRSVAGTILTREVEHADIRIEGRTATFEGEIPPGEGVHPGNVTPPYPPQITWGVTRDADAGTVTVRHEAGDSVAADALALGFTLDPDAGAFAVPNHEPLFTDVETVEPGDTATVDVSDEPAVTVRKSTGDGSADGETTRTATRIEVVYSPDGSYRSLFSFPLEVTR